MPFQTNKKKCVLMFNLFDIIMVQDENEHYTCNVTKESQKTVYHPLSTPYTATKSANKNTST